MTTDWKALCAELVDAWDSTSDFDFNDFGWAAKPIVERARAALFEPEPQPADDLEGIKYGTYRCPLPQK